MTGTSMERATRSAVRWRVPVSDVAMVALGTRCTLARAMREASAARMMAPSILASSERRWGLYSASRRNPPVHTERTAGSSPTTISAPCLACRMRSRPSRSTVPGAIIASASFSGWLPPAPSTTRASYPDPPAFRPPNRPRPAPPPACARRGPPCPAGRPRRASPAVTVRRGRAPGEPGAPGLGQPPVRAGNLADLPGQTQLPEGHQVRRHGAVGDDRGQASATARSAAGSVTVMPPTAATKNSAAPARRPRCDRRGRPPAGWPGRRRGPACAVATRRRPAGTEQRLHLDQERTAPLEHRHHDAAGDAGHAVPQHQRPGVGHGPQAVVAHLEDADLAGGPEAVLDRGQDAQRVVAVPVEGEHGVDQVLDRPGPGQIAVLGHVADQEQRDAARLRHAGQALDAGAHLGQASGRLGQLGVGDRLQRVDDQQRRAVALDRRLDRLDVGPSSASRWRGTRPMRDARPRTWVSDSSAEASMTSTSGAATDESTWKSSVDLPMPGGPNNKVTEPATTPPPRTRSSSLTPVGSGCAPAVEMSASATAEAPAATAPARAAPAGTDDGPNVFHSPQLGQRPTQRSEVASQAVQR